jgi:hypothetical protein
MSRIASAADACAMLPRDQITKMLGTTKNISLNTLKLPPKATEGKACSYAGQENAATVIVIKFESPAAAQAYMETVRKGLEKQSMNTIMTKFDGEDGFSFINGMIAVKRSTWLRVNVNSRFGLKVVNLELTRQLIGLALQVN